MHVVVVGAGYAGVMAANRLAGRGSGMRVTVVNPQADFVERIRLHELAAGTGTATRPLTALLADGVDLHLGRAEKVGDGVVVVRDVDGEPSDVPFDRVILAAGQAANLPDGAVGIDSLGRAQHAAGAIAALPTGATVAVVGSGLTGVEAAAEIARARTDLRVELIGASEPAADFDPRGRARIRGGLERAGVEVVTGSVLEVADGRATLADGGTRAADLVVWAVASGAGAPIGGVAVDPAGRIRVDEYLRSVEDPRVLAVGDIAAVPGMRPSCQAAIPQGAYAADLLIAEGVGSRRARPFSMRFVGRNVSLGRRDAVIQATDRNDHPLRWTIGGRPAAAIKETVCRGVVQAVRLAKYYPA
ncbi:NAD(P)/FAD-dependent oxidoreductase [Millisia brevis]|uniref:NAD(P)/FAD-dependent oxidoreductase n=1 Tax=Millisia brevis TaxID=264148 RepID=UPI0008315D4E|nr:FAD-dependent oxidoreductase [Millisia brevis]